MKSFYFSSTWLHSGKSLLLIGIGRKLAQKKLKVGYFKPLGTNPQKYGTLLTDPNVIVAQKTLKLEDPPELICPVVITQDLIIQAYKGKLKSLREKIVHSFEKLSKNKDIVLIEGGESIQQGTFVGASDITLSKILRSKVVVIDRFSPYISVDSLLVAKEILGKNLLGVILNCVPAADINFVNKRIVPFLNQKNIDVLGVLPFDDVLGSISIRELSQTLGGELLCCTDKQDELVERFSVGAMNVEKALDYFKRARNKAVVTGGDRADIQLAAMETSTKLLILSGNLYPNDIIIAKAEERKIPIMVVGGDTLSVVEKIERTMRQLELRGDEKIKRGMELITQGINFSSLYKRMGI